MKLISTVILLCMFLCIGSAAAGIPAAPDKVYMEGVYYGKQDTKFTLSVAPGSFVKAYSSGVVIIGRKDKNGDAVYHLINTNKKLIIKVSQDNLYRMGEFADWDSITGLVNRGPGVNPSKEKFDDKVKCMIYKIGQEGNVRVCMNEIPGVPIYIEQNGAIVERTTLIDAGRPPLDAAAQLRKYILQKYRYVDADDDISPDAD